MQQQQENLEEYSVETPLPPAFLPYDQTSTALSYDEKHHHRSNNTSRIASGPVDLDDDVDAADNVVDSDDDDEYANHVRHGRSPRFYMLLAGILLIVTVAVGAGVGVAVSGGDSDGSSSNTVQQQAVTTTSKVGGEGYKADSLTPSDGTSAAANNGDAAKDDRIADAGDTVEFGNSGNYDVDTTIYPNTPAPTTEVFDILLTHARGHGVEFKDPNSYQSKAARWVEESAQLGVHTPQRLVQRYALACLYFATNGVQTEWTDELFGADTDVRSWIDETGWLLDEDECGWYQITCDAQGVVTRIELHQNRLTGSFPSEVALLAESLEVVDLYSNPIHNAGPEGNDWLGELTNLRNLFFGRTYFQYDGIPTMIGRLSLLEEFDCSYTLYHGPLQGETFATLSNLEYLHMGGNRYNSSIPYELAELPKLQFLYSEYTDLVGDLSFVPNMPEIIELWLDKNPLLGGPIPSEIGLVTSLRSLSITGCDFEGTIPPELANLRLQQAWIYGNRFEGIMPAAVCATRYPDGRLMDLEADCNDAFQCDCCTKCDDGTGEDGRN